jgi:hypothetical protein
MDTMTKRYVFEKIASSIAEKFKEQGFIYYKTNGRILSIYKDGFDVIILHIVDYNPYFQIQTNIGKRINKVEEIVNKFQEYSFASPKFLKFTETIGTSYMVLSGAKENFIEIKSEEELENAIEELIILIRDKGFDFFEKHKNIELINSIKKEQILKKEHNVIGNIMQSLTLMKLCNDSDFDELCVKFKELYVPFVGEEETGRKAIDDLIAYLRQIY